MERRYGIRVFLLGLCIAASSLPSAAQTPARIGLDHIPVAVGDLDKASATFVDLGFAIKPGRDHSNGIRNAHVKFPDGAGIELLTAPRAVDSLSSYYRDLLRAGEGPAFVSFHARDTGQLHNALSEGGYDFGQEGGITELRSPELTYLFIVRDNRSPTDRPEHFAHPNGATAMRAVWIATEHGDALARLLVQLGGDLRRRQVLAPTPIDAVVVSLAEGEVIILPRRYQILEGRPVIGASFDVPDLSEVRRRVVRAGLQSWQGAGSSGRVVVNPPLAHGMWIEFRESTRETE